MAELVYLDEAAPFTEEDVAVIRKILLEAKEKGLLPPVTVETQAVSGTYIRMMDELRRTNLRPAEPEVLDAGLQPVDEVS